MTSIHIFGMGVEDLSISVALIPAPATLPEEITELESYTPQSQVARKCQGLSVRFH